MSLIKPYYRDSQIKIIETITKTVENDLISKVPDKKDIEEIAGLVIDSNACMLIYNQQGKKIYEKNAIGEIHTARAHPFGVKNIFAAGGWV